MHENEQDITPILCECAPAAKRRIDILSDTLPDDLFGDETMASQMIHAIKANRMLQIRILLKSSNQLISGRHGLLTLIRRLPSFFTVKTLSDDDQDIGHGFVLLDRDKAIYQPFLHQTHGKLIQDKPTLQRLDSEFTTLWDRSILDSNFKQWII